MRLKPASPLCVTAFLSGMVCQRPVCPAGRIASRNRLARGISATTSVVDTSAVMRPDPSQDASATASAETGDDKSMWHLPLPAPASLLHPSRDQPRAKRHGHVQAQNSLHQLPGSRDRTCRACDNHQPPWRCFGQAFARAAIAASRQITGSICPSLPVSSATTDPSDQAGSEFSANAPRDHHRPDQPACQSHIDWPVRYQENQPVTGQGPWYLPWDL